MLITRKRLLLARTITGLVLVVAAASRAAASPPPSERPAAAGADADASPDAPGPDVARGRALLARYCVDCHNENKAKGKLNLATVGHDPARPEYAGAWRQGVGRVRQLEMPPEDAPQPTAAEREALVAWMQWNLDRIAATVPPSAGRVTARRLNRLEYRNTIRDLLGVTFDPLAFDPTRDFPADGAGYGFDNIGDVLSVSPLHMEQYLSAAEQVLDRAIVIEGLDGPTTRRFEAKALRVAGIGAAAGADPAGDAWTPRGWSADIDVRQPGEYLVRAEIVSQEANRKQAQMAFMLDGGKLEKLTLTREGKANRTERRVKLGKGPQQVAVAYLHEQGKPNFEPADGANGGFAVTYLELVGPVGVTRQAAPATHKDVFVAHPGGGKTRRQAAGEVVATFAARAFRRPVAPAEVERYLKLFDAADVDGETFEAACRAPLTAILVSPHFLYRVEPHRPPETPAGDYALAGYELASRLSYFIWSSMPDAELLRLAGEGRLTDPTVLEQQARRMIADPKAAVLGEAFATQWLQVRGVDTLPQPDPKQFGKLGTALKDAMRAERVMLFQHVLRTGRPLTDLLDADYTFVNGELARHYKLDGVKGKEIRLVKLADARRGGVLTMAGVLAVTSHPDRTSPVRRGKWVLDAVLGAPPPPPPPDVGELPPGEVTKDGKVQQVSLRARLEQHRSAAACAACHKRMDPLGFALEHYDAVGRWRDKDGKLPVDAAATLPDGRPVNGPVELKRLMVAERDAFTACAAEKLLTFALGRGVEEPDRPVVAQVAKATAAAGYSSTASSSRSSRAARSATARPRRPPTSNQKGNRHAHALIPPNPPPRPRRLGRTAVAGVDGPAAGARGRRDGRGREPPHAHPRPARAPRVRLRPQRREPRQVARRRRREGPRAVADAVGAGGREGPGPVYARADPRPGPRPRGRRRRPPALDRQLPDRRPRAQELRQGPPRRRQHRPARRPARRPPHAPAVARAGVRAAQPAGHVRRRYSGVYRNCISWRTPTSPVPTETNPRQAFVRLFGDPRQGGDAGRAARDRMLRTSILDLVREDAAALTRTVGGADRQKFDEYLESVRAVERQIQVAERIPARALPEGTRMPAGTPPAVPDHIKVMLDLMVLAYQTDSTRIISLMLANGGSSRNFPFIGVQSAHHHYSHHEGRPENLDALQKIDMFYAEQFAYLVRKLKAIPEAGGTLLDRCLLLYGSPLRDGNKHDRHDLPVLLAGGGGGLVTPGRCVKWPVETPMANLFLTMLDGVGVGEEHFSDSTGRLNALTV